MERKAGSKGGADANGKVETTSGTESKSSGTGKGDNAQDKGRANLIPFTQLTEEEQRALAVKGGKASGEARRRKKSLKDLANILLESQITDTSKVAEIAANMGIDTPSEDLTVGMSIMLSMALEAQAGNHKAAEFVRDTAGQKPVTDINLDANVMTDADKELLANVAKRQGLQTSD